MIAFAALMTARYQTGTTGTFRTCQGDTSEHYDSRALDWMNILGPITAAAVKAVQSRAKLAPTGVVSGATWVAIEKQMPR